MQTICELDASSLWTGGTRAVEATDGAPPGWVFADPPELLDGQVARWLGEWRIEPAPAPPIAEPPASVTNSDWRVGLILWKRPDGTARFDEVEAKVTAARDSGTDQGKIVWQRWEYANDVYRAELMALRDQFGFSSDEVDESLLRAQAVGDQAKTSVAA